MPPVYVTPTGLQIPSTQDLLDRVAANQRADLNALLDTDPDSPVGQLNGILMSLIRELWEVALIAFTSLDPNQAEGVLLEAVAAISGTLRAKATRSKFTGSRRILVNLDASTTLPLGSVASVSGNPLIRFVTMEAITAGPILGDYPVAASCETIGPIVCNAGTLTVIATPVVGWNSVTNPFDAEVGQAIDLDPELRIRREEELRSTGSTNPDSLRADLLAIQIGEDKPVLSVVVFSNDGDTYNTEGLPPHSLEALVYDGVGQDCPDDTLAQVIWDGKPGGIQVIGSSSGVALDSNGDPHTVPFSRATILDIAFVFTLSVDVDTFAGVDAAKDAVVAKFKAKVKQGSVIRCNDYIGALMALSGVIDVPFGIQITINGSSFPPSGTNLTLGLREMGNTQASWIGVTVL